MADPIPTRDITKITPSIFNPDNDTIIGTQGGALARFPGNSILTAALIAQPNAAEDIGTHDGPLQTALDARVKLSDLAEPATVEIGGFSAAYAQNILDNGVVLPGYVELRAYGERGASVLLSSPGVNGQFKYDATDSISADNGITIIVDALGRRWKRQGVIGNVNVQWAGVMPGPAYAANNCSAYARLIAYVRTVAKDLIIFWPPGEYQFSPKDNPTYSGGLAYDWRNAIELVDVSNIYHWLDGVTIYVRADANWYRGNSTPVAGLDESPIQFRALSAGACKFVGFYGAAVFKTDATLPDTGTSHSDGAAFGVAYRGCQYTHTDTANYEFWGTDGLYFGTDYANTFSGEYHTVKSPRVYRAYRNSISIVGNNHGNIYGGSLEETRGGSFGHGIDFEPNGGKTQSHWTLYGTSTKNNQRGACNFINTSDVTWINPSIDEQYASAAGAVYIDGSNVVGYDVKNIAFYRGYIKSLQPILYVSGSAVAGGGIDNVTFDGCSLSCVGPSPSSNAFLRINAAGNTGMRMGRFFLRNCNIEGNGGIALKSDGTNETKIQIIGGRWHLKNFAGTALAFTISTATVLDVIDIENIQMSVEPTMTMATNTPYIVKGSLKNCVLRSVSTAVINWIDYGAGRTQFVIGTNEFSAYNYYKGVVTTLDSKTLCTIESTVAGDFGLSGRIVHGGRQRILAYANSTVPFIDRQAPKDGDICRNIANSGAGISELEFTYDGNASRWRLTKSFVRRGPTALRPTPAASPVGYAALLEGLPYMDTTLAAGGKFIHWNGSDWVDGDGTVV